jgi:hypothetical protein
MPERTDNSMAIVHSAYAGSHFMAGRHRRFEEIGL